VARRGGANFPRRTGEVRRRNTGPAGIILLFAIALTGLLSGCGSVSGVLKPDDAWRSAPADVAASEAVAAAPTPAIPMPSVALVEAAGEAVTTEQPVEPSGEREDSPALLSLAEADDPPSSGRLPHEIESVSALAQASQETTEASDEEYDPWEPFNEKMFTFNRNLDRFVLKPVARGYMFIMPEPFQVMIGNGFDNINFVPRVVNNLLQGKWNGAGRELARFLINSTAGVGGLFDPAKDYWGIQRSREDFGQTLGVWGSGPGPFLVLPFMEPLTVRDGIGKGIDSLMDPLSYLLPFIWTRLSMKLGDIVNERALNYDLFQGFEESVIDMYSAVRHGYLQRRQNLIRE
jgi:phospholipid-binding lipoprotein MlaA